MKFIISIDGRTCSGKSTIILQLQNELKKRYGISVPYFSCGQHYRTNLQGKIPNELVDDEMIKFMRSVYENNDVAIIDGRSVSFAIKSGDILQSNKPLLSVLIDVDKDVQFSRLLDRVNSNHPEPLKYALERDDSDEARCFARYKKNIFDKLYYDLYINTSNTSVHQAVDKLLEAIAHGCKTKKKTLLYAEETETPMGRKLMERKDINVIYLRFEQHLNFNHQYLVDTYTQNVFTVSASRPIDEEVLRFHSWTLEIGITPDYFYNGSEFLQEKANYFAKLLGLASLSLEQTLLTRDKVEMKTKLHSSGIPVMPFMGIDNLDEIKEFAKIYKYPIIFKRRKGQSCIDTYKLTSNYDIAQLPYKEIPPHKFMVEKFDDGKEWIIDGLVQDGKVLRTFITYVPNSPLTAMVEQSVRGHIAVNETPGNFNFIPRNLIQSIITMAKLRNGYIHLECFIDKNGKPTVGEFGWRPSGHRIIENHSYVTGMDIYDLIIDVVTGKPVKIEEHKNGNTVIGNVFLPQKSGLVTDVLSNEQVLEQDGVFRAEIYSRVGDFHQMQRKSSETAGYAFIKGVSVLSVETKMRQMFKYFYENMKTTKTQ